MRVLIATNNKHKVKEISDIFRGTGIEPVSPADIGLKLEVDENGSTFEENAMKKADEFCKASGFVCIADDSGLAVDCLSGAPGVYSARYAGENATDAENIRKLLAALEHVPPQERTARFCSVVCLITESKEELFGEGSCEGQILTAPEGDGGFGYDPVFFSKDFGQSFGALTHEQKNSISHRKRALTDLLAKLRR